MDIWTEVMRAAIWTVTVVVTLGLLLILVYAIDEGVTGIERWRLRRKRGVWLGKQVQKQGKR